MLVQKTSPGRHRTLFIYQQYQGAEDPACGLAPSSDSDGALAFVLAAYWETVITLPGVCTRNPPEMPFWSGPRGRWVTAMTEIPHTRTGVLKTDPSGTPTKGRPKPIADFGWNNPLDTGRSKAGNLLLMSYSHFYNLDSGSRSSIYSRCDLTPRTLAGSGNSIPK